MKDRTKDVRFQFGTRKSITVSTEKVWDFLFSEKELNIWLINATEPNIEFLLN